jgi:GDPmannose 4,6-dehydratase
MWLMLQQRQPDDYILATGEMHSVREFIERAFAVVQRPIIWRGSGTEEHGIDAKLGRVVVRVDPRYFRPTEVDLLVGDPTKAREKLGWSSATSFDDLVSEMVVSDIRKLQSELSRHGSRHLRTVQPSWEESVGRWSPGDGRFGGREAARVRGL